MYTLYGGVVIVTVTRKLANYAPNIVASSPSAKPPSPHAAGQVARAEADWRKGEAAGDADGQEGESAKGGAARRRAQTRGRHSARPGRSLVSILFEKLAGLLTVRLLRLSVRAGGRTPGPNLKSCYACYVSHDQSIILIPSYVSYSVLVLAKESKKRFPSIDISDVQLDG